LSDVPATVELVTRDQLDLRVNQTPDQALALTPGLYVSRNRGPTQDTTYNSIVIRGIPEQKRTLFLLDGVPLNNGFLGRFFGGGVDDLERLEVVKGASSSLYGGAAMGGVINAITRMPTEREATLKTGFGSDLGSSNGVKDRMRVYGSYGDQIGRFSLFGSVAYSSATGYPSDLVVNAAAPTAGITGQTGTLSRTGGSAFLIGDRGDTRPQDMNFLFKGAAELAEGHKLSFTYNRTDARYDYSGANSYLRNAAGARVFSYGTVAESVFLGGPERLLQDVYAASYKGEVGPGELTVTASLVDRGNDNGYVTPASTATRFGGAGTLTNTPSQNYRIDSQYVVRFAEAHRVTTGFTVAQNNARLTERTLANWRDRNATAATTNRAEGRDVTYSVFAQDEWTPSDRWTVQLGARGDFWRTYDGSLVGATAPGGSTKYGERTASAISPKAGLSYKPVEDVTLRSTIGTAFRTPTIFELYTTTRTGSFTFQSNPNLKPETAVTFDFGGEWRVTPKTSLTATYFHTELDDLIYYQTVGTTFRYLNAGHARIDGAEFGLKTAPIDGLKLFANLTLTDSRITENRAVPASVGKQIVGVPKTMVNFGAEYRIQKWELGGYGRFVSKRFSNDNNLDTATGVFDARDPYFVADASVGYELFPGVSARFFIDNIFDEKYFDSRVAPGRSWFFETSVKF
jgi:iron complex outermembrane receptor protein